MNSQQHKRLEHLRARFKPSQPEEESPGPSTRDAIRAIDGFIAHLRSEEPYDPVHRRRVDEVVLANARSSDERRSIERPDLADRPTLEEQMLEITADIERLEAELEDIDSTGGGG